MNVPLLGDKNRQVQMRAFEDALRELAGQALQAGIAGNVVGMTLIGLGLSLHTQATVNHMAQMHAAPTQGAPPNEGLPG